MKAIVTASVFVCGFALSAYYWPYTRPATATGTPDTDTPPQQDFDWPPTLHHTYPELSLMDQTGQQTRLSDFRGHIILVEPIGMPCAACQAFCGGHRTGGFGGIEPQSGLLSLHEAARQYGAFDLADERIIKVYLLLYGMDMQPPTPQDAQAWAEHFGMDRLKNEIVLTGLPSMIGDHSFAMIPGVQLIDQDFTLCVDSTGRSSEKQDLYRDLLPTVRALQTVTDTTAGNVLVNRQ